MKKLLYIIYVIIAVTILLEIVLRVYNPFPSGIMGDKIVLRVNTTLQYDNDSIPVLEKNIIHTKNSLGFRGPDKPHDWNKYFTIFTIGGSTTECTYLSDNKTWTDKLFVKLRDGNQNLWMNNAGIAGHSTSGHKILFEDYIVKLNPDMILFLVGCNDINRDDLVEKSVMKDHYGSIAAFFTKNSVLFNVISNTFFNKRSKSKNFTDKYIDISKHQNDTLTFSDAQIKLELDKQRHKYLPGYEERLNFLINSCIKNNIQPVLITQPSLFGEGRDPVTGANLENRRIGLYNYNGKLWWLVLEEYNNVTRKVAKDHQILLIDLAKKMPRSSLYFYDMVHFTEAGADTVSQIIYKELNNSCVKIY